MTKRTKEVSRLVGVSRRTLQYYDDEGVICVIRTKNNHRIYDQNTLEQIWRVMVYKEMGFTLKEIKNLLEISDHEQKERCEARLQTVRKQMKEMKKQAEFITAVIKGGIPDAPEEDSGVTYAEYMESIRNGLQDPRIQPYGQFCKCADKPKEGLFCDNADKRSDKFYRGKKDRLR